MTNNGTRFYIVSLLVLVSLTFVFIGLDKVNEASDPAFEDTQNFLEVALYIKDNGGIFNFINFAFSGQYKSVIQHPLYPLLLSTFASREAAFFGRAKLLSLLAGFLVVVTFFLITKVLYGETVAYVASPLLIFNATFLQISSHVACETLLILFMLLSFFCMVKGINNSNYWIWAGITAGLAYLTKGTGLMLVPMFAIVNLFVFGQKVIGNFRFWIFFVAFFITCSPLVGRNIVVYSQPLYENGTYNSLWFDSWWESYDVKYGIAVKFPETTWVSQPLPTMQSYLRTHSFSEIMNRVTYGILGEAKLIRYSLASIFPDRLGQYLPSLMVFFFAIGLILEGKKARTLFTLAMIAVIFFPFAWFYQVVPAVRYITPLIPLVCIYSAIGLIGASEAFDKWVLAKFGDGKGSLVARLPAVVMVFLVLIASYVIITQQVHLPGAPLALAQDQEELASWIRGNVKHDDLIVVSTDNRIREYLWQVGLRGEIGTWLDGVRPHERWKYFKQQGLTSVSELQELFKNIPVKDETYVSIHMDDIVTTPSLFVNYFTYDEVDGIIETRHLDGWNLAYKSSKMPSMFLIYQIDKAKSGS